jgi:hypothetical protein
MARKRVGTSSSEYGETRSVSFWDWVLCRTRAAEKILRSAQNDTFAAVILNPSAVLRINSMKELIWKLIHY